MMRNWSERLTCDHKETLRTRAHICAGAARGGRRRRAAGARGPRGEIKGAAPPPRVPSEVPRLRKTTLKRQ